MSRSVTREDIANYVNALFDVYILLIFLYILLEPCCSRSASRPPYARCTDAVLNFLRDVCDPYLKIFRKFIPPIGMFDLSADDRDHRSVHREDGRGQPDHGLNPDVVVMTQAARSLRTVAFARAALVAAIVIALDQITKHTLAAGIAAGERRRSSCPA